jgi:K+-transporting ATPase KdpF subunit
MHAAMNWELILAGAAAIGLLGYLVAALLNPERF